MITDKELLVCWPSRSDMDINDKKIWFARQVIRMAQEVRPLVFLQNNYGVLIAETAIGRYHINTSEYSVECFYVEQYKMTCIDASGNSEAEAIAAAQADFNRRVLENLVHRGAE